MKFKQHQSLSWRAQSSFLVLPTGETIEMVSAAENFLNIQIQSSDFAWHLDISRFLLSDYNDKLSQIEHSVASQLSSQLSWF